MRVKPAVLVALLGVLAGVALVQRAGAPDPLAADALALLLEQPLDATPGAPESDGTPTWRALLERFGERTPGGLGLRLGRVLSDPTAARASAESAGELLALEAQGPQGSLGQPLWRAILAGPALEPGPPPALKLYGCRHTALPEAGPALEDTYCARLALGQALRTHAASEPGSGPLTLVGEHVPMRGGVNFEVQLLAGTQSVVVTFDGHQAPPLRATRAYQPSAPNDARARANLVQVLRERAAEAGLGTLTITDAEPSADDALDVRIEQLGERQSLVARRGATRLATHRLLEAARAREK